MVANEVKELAKQTAKATEDISQRIGAIQTDAKSAVEAIRMISEIIGQVNDIASTIATAVEEQSATTSEMSRNVSEAARGSGEVAKKYYQRGDGGAEHVFGRERFAEGSATARADVHGTARAGGAIQD